MVGCATALGSLLLISIVAFVGTRSLVNNQKSVVHTQEVISELQTVLTALVDAETGQRGYLITGDERYIGPFNSGSKEIYESIDRVSQLTVDNPRQQAILPNLIGLVDIKIAELSQTIELRRIDGFDAAQAVVLTDAGRKTADDIRAIIGDMIAEEEGLLTERTTSTSASSRLVNIVLVVGFGVTLIIAGVTGKMVIDGTKELSDANEKLADEVRERGQAEQTLRALNEALREQARRDPLTKVLNHGAILEEIRSLLADGGTDVSHAVAMIDVDGLKAVNDASGHQVGDVVLKAVAGALSKDGAIVGRYGGDEFVAVLPGVDRAGAERYRDGVLKQLQGARVTDPATGARVPVAASIGLSVYPAEANTLGEMIRLSDRAMYASRRQRPMRADGRSPAGPLGSDRAAEMVGQIVPLLTSPGQLEDKLRLVSQRICVGAGYDAVNIDLFDEAGSISRVRSAFSEVPDEVVEAWRAQRRRIEDEPILQEIRSSGRAVIVDDPQNDERLTETQRAVLRAAELRSAVVTPLFWGEQFIGALSVASKREAAFTVLDVEFLTAVADQVTAIARMANMVEELQSTSARLATAQDQTVMLLAAAAEAHDETTGLHLRGVRALVETLAQELGYDEDEARDLGLAAVLHDIGKIRVADSILARNGPLPAEDWEIMKQHTIWGAELLVGRPGLELSGTIARSHHEQWDGSGYPDGLAGEAIPEQVSIVTVADAFDAMTHDRPYQASRSLEEAVREIARCSGQQFSPRVVEALQRLHRRNALPFPIAQAREDRAAA